MTTITSLYGLGLAIVTVRARGRTAAVSSGAASGSETPATGRGTESGPSTVIQAGSSGGRASTGTSNRTRSVTESAATTSRIRGPTESCTNANSSTLAVSVNATVTESHGSRGSSARFRLPSTIPFTSYVPG